MQIGSLEVEDLNLKSRTWLTKFAPTCKIYVTYIRGESDGEPDEVPFKSGKVYSIYDLCKFLEDDLTCYVELSGVGDGKVQYDLAAAEPGNVFYPMGFILARKGGKVR